MRKIPLFAFILVSVSLLSGSYHQTSAIGIDSSSHGLLYGGRVVRRYGNLGNDKNLFNKRYPRQPTGLQVRQDQDDPPAKGAKGKGTDEDNSPKGKGTDEDNSPKAKGTDEDDSPKGKAAPKAKESPKEQPAKAKPKEDATKQPAKAKATPTPNQPNQQSPPSDSDDSDTTDTTTNGVDAASTANDQSVPSAAGAGTPTVATGGLSTAALAGLASIGGVFVLVAGLFAFGQRRKNKEMTKSIVSTSAKAWEQQNSTYEKMEEEAEPIGSYTVIATYTPTLADELDIQPGDKVTILVEFDDGWVQGVNETRGGTKGVFPRHCVDMDHVSSFRNNKRSSSMGVFSEKYTEVDLN